MYLITRWADALADDVDVARTVLDAEGAPAASRQLAASALTYLVMRMDLIPDWNPTIGVLDDAMVLRTCLELATEHDVVGALDEDAQRQLGRLSNEVDIIQRFLGVELFARLRRHCARLLDLSVRGHSPRQCARSAEARAALYRDLASEIEAGNAGQLDKADRAFSPDDVQQLDAIAARLRSYLQHKLSA